MLTTRGAAPCRAAGARRAASVVVRRLARRSHGRVLSTSHDSATLCVWSFNLRTSFCEEEDGPDGWRYRAGGCAALIKRHSPAVLCVQEATQPMLDSLCGRLGYQWHGLCRSGTGEDEHSALVWDPARLRLLRGETRWLSPASTECSIGWDAMFPRIFTRGLFELIGSGSENGEPQQVAIASTHFDHVGHEARLRSAAILRSLLSSTEGDEWGGSSTVPTILCGDFNSIKSSDQGSAYATLTAGPGGFEDAWVLCPEESRSRNGLDATGSTIHKFEGLSFCEDKGDGTVDLRFRGSDEESASAAEERTGGSAQHIDWVLLAQPPDTCRTQLTPVAAAVITEQCESLASPAEAAKAQMAVGSTRYPSDHFPVAVEFRVTQVE